MKLPFIVLFTLVGIESYLPTEGMLMSTSNTSFFFILWNLIDLDLRSLLIS